MGLFVTDASVRQFLLKNLMRQEDGTFGLRLNVKAIASGITNVGTALPADAKINCPLLFIGGETSNYITPADEVEIKERFPQAKVIMVPRAGHWIHVDQPVALASYLEDFFGF